MIEALSTIIRQLSYRDEWIKTGVNMPFAAVLEQCHPIETSMPEPRAAGQGLERMSRPIRFEAAAA